MGVLQLETSGRPDGFQPHGFETFYDYLKSEETNRSDDYVLTEDECVQVDREFVQFYHRRICWLQLKDFDRVVADAEHTLQLMDFCKDYSPSEQWTLSHEQYRPFVIYHRTQAAAMHVLDEDLDPEIAIEEINLGLARLKSIFESYEAMEQYEEDELVTRLTEFRENLRSRYEVGQTLEEKLKQAIADEQYEQAAKIRDQMENRRSL